MKTKKVFLSYSTEFPEHQEWVRNLSDQLTKHGISNTFDLYDLKAGQDMYSFMETIIEKDIHEKVVIISDWSYAHRANTRKGGVGSEIQVLAPEVYGDVQQTRVIPVFTEVNDKGEPSLPHFLKGKYAINFSNPEAYEQSYATLYLAITNTPLHKRPTLRNPLSLEELEQMRAAAKRKPSSTPKNKNINKGDIEEVEEVHIGDSNAVPDTKQYENKNIQEGNVKKVKKFRLGDDYES